MSAAPKPLTIDEMTERAIRLRDAIKEADKKHKEKMARPREALEELENLLLAAIPVIILAALIASAAVRVAPAWFSPSAGIQSREGV